VAGAAVALVAAGWAVAGALLGVVPDVLFLVAFPVLWWWWSPVLRTVEAAA